MPVTAMPVSSTLQIVVQTGVNANGNPVLRNRSYRNVKTGASEADVQAVGQSLAGLQNHPVNAIHRLNELDLVVS